MTALDFNESYAVASGYFEIEHNSFLPQEDLDLVTCDVGVCSNYPDEPALFGGKYQIGNFQVYEHASY